jgi:hypothetical protein
MMYRHAPRQAVNKQANKDSILFIDLEIRFIEVKDIISSYIAVEAIPVKTSKIL